MVQARMKRPVGRPRGEQVENAARRRRQLIEAAIDSIVEVGFSATTLATFPGPRACRRELPCSTSSARNFF